MAGAFSAYMAMKGLKKVWKPSVVEIIIYSMSIATTCWLASIPFVKKRSIKISDRKKDINSLFNFPLIIGVALLSFAHGANDVANAIGPLAAIVSTFSESTVAAKVCLLYTSPSPRD